jgi:hypothetical protein
VTTRAVEVSALFVPVLLMPLDLIGEQDPELAERIRCAVRLMEHAIAEERHAGAVVTARRLFALLMSAWGRGLLEYDELEGLVDLLSLFAAELRGAAQAR